MNANVKFDRVKPGPVSSAQKPSMPVAVINGLPLGYELNQSASSSGTVAITSMHYPEFKRTNERLVKIGSVR